MATANLLFSIYISNIDSNFRSRRIWSNSFYDETLDERHLLTDFAVHCSLSEVSVCC